MNGTANASASRTSPRPLLLRSRGERLLAAAAMVLLSAGCAQEFVRRPEPARPAPPPPVRSAPPPVNLSGYSAAFKEGFAAGCDTARGAPRRDDARMQSDAQYAQGWQDGRSICAKR